MTVSYVMELVRAVMIAKPVTVVATLIATKDVMTVSLAMVPVRVVLTVRCAIVVVMCLVTKDVMTVRRDLIPVRDIPVRTATQPAITILQQLNRLRAETLLPMAIPV